MLYITTKESLEKIRANVRLRRIDKGITQVELAKRVGVCLTTIRRFERNQNIGVELFISIAFVLDFLPDLVEASKIYNFKDIKGRVCTQKGDKLRSRARVFPK